MRVFGFFFRFSGRRQREAKEKKEAEEKARKEVRFVSLARFPYVGQCALAAVDFGSCSLSVFAFGFGLSEYAGADTIFTEGRSRSEGGTVTRRICLPMIPLADFTGAAQKEEKVAKEV